MRWTAKDWAWAGGGLAVGVGWAGWRLGHPKPSAVSGASSASSTASGTTPSSNTTSQATSQHQKTTCSSPYGCDQAAGPTKSCPSGYAPQFVAGVGWTCAETLAQEQHNFQKLLDSLPEQGGGFSGNAEYVPGQTVLQSAQAAQAFLEAKYGQSYVILQQNGGYLVTPEARAAALNQLPTPEISGSSVPGVNASELNQAIADAQSSGQHYTTAYAVYYNGTDYFVVPHGGTPPSGAQLVYSTASGTTSAGQAILNAATGYAQATSNTGAVNTSSTTSSSGTSVPGPSGSATSGTSSASKTPVTFYETAGPCINGMETVTRHYSDGTTSSFQSVCIS